MNDLAISDLAINGGTPFKKNKFPKWPMYTNRETELLNEVVTSNNWWRMTGSKVEEFEEKFAKHHNAEYCIAVTNGTHAIELLLSAFDIGRGDEVIIPAFTFISTATAPIYCDATPIPVDVDPGTFCIDPKAIAKAITANTKAIIPVHMAGHICDMEAISKIAKEHNLIVIEDAAHAHGAQRKGQYAGTFSDAASFSFQNGKLMTSGEGGAIITNNKDIYEKAFLIHGVGRPKKDTKYQHLLLGSNYRMSEFQAAVLIAQLERLDELNSLREKNAAVLDKLLVDIEGINPQLMDREATVNPRYMYMFYYDKNYFGNKDRQWFIEALRAEGIPAFMAYPVVSKTEFFSKKCFRGHIEEGFDFSNLELPCSDNIAENVIWLPHFTLLGDKEDINDIAGAIKKIQKYSY